MNHSASARPKSQAAHEKSSRLTEDLLTIAQVAKLLPAPWTEARLGRWVRSGRLHAIRIEPDWRAKKWGRQPSILIALADVLALEPSAAPRKQEVPPRKKSSIAATASKQKAAGDAATRN